VSEVEEDLGRLGIENWNKDITHDKDIWHDM